MSGLIHNCPICGVNVDKMSDEDYGFHIIDCQEKRIAELEKPILCAKCNDHIIADDGAICEICADTQDTIITELQARVAELEKLAVVWHKYPDEKPDDNRDCLVFGKAYCVMSSSIGVGYYENDEWVCEENGDITHYAELPAPPEPKPAFKAGDWVEIEVAGVISQHRVKYGVFVDSINAGGFEFYGNGLPVMKPSNARIIRKLDPSEVIVKIGCLEGTVSDAGGESFYMNKPGTNGNIYCIIEYRMLDTATRELVESLLKAQEEQNG